jgi:hypothetical protein
MKDGPNYDLLRQGAHHVMVNQKEDGFNDLLVNLMKVLEPGAVSESAMIAEYEILNRMKAKT